MGPFAFMLGLMERRQGDTMETPGVWEDPEDRTILGTNRTGAGVPVTRQKAIEYAAVWRAVTMISTDVAKLPLFVYERRGDMGKDRAVKHPAYRLLRWRANDEMNAFYFRKLLMTHVLLAGNGFAFIRRDNAGSPSALLPLDPELTMVKREEGEPLAYETQVGFEKVRLPARDVLHIHGCGWGGHDGWHLVNKAKESLGVGIAARDYGGRFFGNNAYPGGVLKHPGVLKDTAKKALRESWEAMHSGIEAAHRTAILEEGMEFQRVGHTAEESQLLELRRHEIREVANWFGIPPHKLGDDTKTSFSSLEQENQQYLNDALDGWLSTWEAECRDKLFTERQKSADSHIVEFKRAALVRADIKTRYEAYKIAIMHGILSPDEARDLENLNPIPNGKGDVYLTPANLKELGEEPEVEPPPSPPQFLEPPALPAPDDEDARRKLLHDLGRRITKRVWAQAKRASHKPDRFVDWIETIVPRNIEHIAGITEPVLAVCSPGENATAYASAALRTLQAELLEISGQAKPDTLSSVLDGEYERLETVICNGGMSHA